MNIFDIFLKSNFLIQIIMLGLLSCSIFLWGIIIYQIYVFYYLKKEITYFENKFWSGMPVSQLYQESTKNRTMLYGMEKIFYSGFKKFSQLYYINHYPEKILLKEIIRIMNIAIYTILEESKKNILFFNIISSISPYLGLFGTILSIIDIFFILDTEKYITWQIIFPKIAESLIFISWGLLLTIPSIIAFYQLNLMINNIEQKYKFFSEEFISLLKKQIFSKNLMNNST